MAGRGDPRLPHLRSLPYHELELHAPSITMSRPTERLSYIETVTDAARARLLLAKTAPHELSTGHLKYVRFPLVAIPPGRTLRNTGAGASR